VASFSRKEGQVVANEQTATVPLSAAQVTVAALINRARVAQRAFERCSQAEVDEAVLAAGWAIMEPGRNRLLADMAVRDTGLGDVEDKITKNYRKTLGLLRDLKGVKTVGIVAEYPELGLVEIARPVGVVAGHYALDQPGGDAGQQSDQCTQVPQCRHRRPLTEGPVVC